jgi:hypothetical protein
MYYHGSKKTSLEYKHHSQKLNKSSNQPETHWFFTTSFTKTAGSKRFWNNWDQRSFDSDFLSKNQSQQLSKSEIFQKPEPNGSFKIQITTQHWTKQRIW